MKNTIKPNELNTEKFYKLLDKFIIESKKGIRLRTNGKRMGKDSIQNYQTFKRLLLDFERDEGFKIKLYRVNKLDEEELKLISKYWKTFFVSFTNYLYKTRDFYDNYVWVVFRVLKTFFNYLNKECHLNIGIFHKSFHIPAEDIPIMVLTPEQLKELIYDNVPNNKLPLELDRVRDIFVFGCTVALRFGDLSSISKENIYHFNGGVYLKVTSSKSSTHSSIKLPDYAIDIIKKYESTNRKTIFPPMTNGWLNKKLKLLAKHLKLNDEMIRYRCKRGVKHVIYKNKTKRQHFTVGDHLTTHTMRRTAITNMLRMKVPEQIVRKISGHTANSAEFYKYVDFAQNYLDEHTEEYFKKMRQPL
jgi:integrase